MAAQMLAARVSSLTVVVPSVDPVSYFRRTWPPTVLTIALIINAAWMGLLAYGLFELGKRVALKTLPAFWG